MRILAASLISTLMVSACAAETSGDNPTPTVTDPVAVTSSPTTSTSFPTTTTGTGPVVAWIAPSGVPMPVTAMEGSAVEVLTPCGGATWLDAGTPVHMVDVVLDPGHGGPIDTGAVGANGLKEKEINLRVALAARDELERRGIATMLTRVGDYPIPIPTRSDYADLVGAAALVSIHHNAPQAPASEVPGVEIFVQQSSQESQRLGGLLYDATMATLSRFDVDWDRSPDAGVMTVLNSRGDDAYGMVRHPDTPSALIELGYIANPAEAAFYRTPGYVPSVAEALAEAIEDFVTSDEMGAALVEGRVFDPRSGVGADQCVDVDLERPLYPDVVDVVVTERGDDLFDFSVTISSPYDSPDRYADGFRVIGDDGLIYGTSELTHDHANEQPFTRTLSSIEIPATVRTVIVEGRDQVYGWGGSSVEVSLR